MQASRAVREGAGAFAYPGVTASMAAVVAAIEAAAPEVAGRITWPDQPLPFPEELESGGLEAAIGPVRKTAARRRRP